MCIDMPICWTRPRGRDTRNPYSLPLWWDCYILSCSAFMQLHFGKITQKNNHPVVFRMALSCFSFVHHHSYGANLMVNCEIGVGEVVTVSYYIDMIKWWHVISGILLLLLLSHPIPIWNSKKVVFAVMTGGSSLGFALPELQTLAAAIGSAGVIHAILDRVSVSTLPVKQANRVTQHCHSSASYSIKLEITISC